MPILIDTNVAIHLRDEDFWVIERIATLGQRPVLSIMSLVELEAGVFRNDDLIDVRRSALEAMLAGTSVLELGRDVISAYGQIVGALGFSRVRVIDRLIAATAIVNDLTLVTINAPDFRDIPGLALEVWAPPGQ